MATKKSTTVAKKTATKAPARATKPTATKSRAGTKKAKVNDTKAVPVGRRTKTKTEEKTLKVKGKTPKEIATAKGEPYISILSVELDPENIGNGAFELDWNEKFITNLVRAGYQSKPGESEDVIVDRWFQEVCRNIAQENFEQWEANQPYGDRPRVINRRDVGDGRTEVS